MGAREARAPWGQACSASSRSRSSGTQGDKAHDTLDALLAAVHEPVDDTTFELAKNAIVEEYRADRVPPRDVASVVYAWDDQGARADPRAARIERIRAVDRATFDAWLRNAVGGRMLVSLTGDRTRLDDARLGKLAPLTWVPVAQLYGY